MSDARTLDDLKESLLEELFRDRWKAHSLLFPHRHPDKSPAAHRELVRRINAPRPHISIEGFRGMGKSTYVEETVVLKAIFKEFHNCLIVGSSYKMACDRLQPIARELLYNEELLSLTGHMRGDVWREDRIVLANGVCIQAMGRDAEMTGTKYGDWRPDAVLLDDVESPEEIRTDAQREQTWRWFTTVFLPALDHPLYSWVRVLGTRRGVGSLPERLEADGWPTAKFPFEYIDDQGIRRATWPAKFPLDAIDKIKATYRGDMHTYMQEFMCQASSEADRVFTREMFRVEPRQRTWQAVYAMVDPARTTNRTSATTGYAVWSWVGARLIVWAAGAQMLKPDEIIDLIFTICEEYNPVWCGVEEDGLNEFILQPLRHEQARRGKTIPVRAVRAPRGKLDFIRGLQPFFSAGEVIFNAPLPELEAQFLSFPTGKIDAPNALAYALQMRPAAPVYDGAAVESLVDEHDPDAARPLYLAAHIEGATACAVLCQKIRGRLLVFADWMEEGSADEAIPRIQAEASLLADASFVSRPRPVKWQDALKLPDISPILRREPIRWIVPLVHGDQWNNTGLMQAIRRLPAQVSAGADCSLGRVALRRAMGQGEVSISERAGWTLRALAGGYSRSLRKGGTLSDDAEKGPYRVLMEAVEALCGIGEAPEIDSEESTQPLSFNRHGQAYRSILPTR